MNASYHILWTSLEFVAWAGGGAAFSYFAFSLFVSFLPSSWVAWWHTDEKTLDELLGGGTVRRLWTSLEFVAWAGGCGGCGPYPSIYLFVFFALFLVVRQ